MTEASGQAETWIVLGATSGIARAFVRLLAARGAHLVLAGRTVAELELIAEDCRHRGAASAETASFDARDPSGYRALVEALVQRPGTLNAASFVGSMPDQALLDADPSLISGVVADNFTGPAQFLTLLLPALEARGKGVIIGTSSVAGDRGRLGNYVYGGSKAGFATYLSGLRNRARRKGVHVMTVKPGPVDTVMTWGRKMPFMAAPEAVAKTILEGADKRRNIVYCAPIWQAISLIIRMIPEAIFKRLSI